MAASSHEDFGELSRKSSKQVEDYDSDEAEGKALAVDILKNGDKHFIENRPILLPPWYSQELVSSGQEYFHNNMFNMFVAKLSGLLALLAAPSIIRVLHKTDKSSKPATAYKRYLSTIMHMVLWYQSDLRNPNSKGRQSVATVRGLHSAASRLAGPITQKDLALTQFGFVGFAILSAKKLGLPYDQTGLVHFWRVIGHLMGTQDRFNLFRGNLRCTIAACEELAKEFFCPNLDNPPENFEKMSEALLEGMWPLIVFYSPAGFKEFTRRLCGCPPRSLPFIPFCFLYFQIFVHKLLQIPVISFFLLPFLNFQIWFTIFVQNTMPILAFMSFNRSLMND